MEFGLMRFRAFSNVEDNGGWQIQKLKSHLWIPKNVTMQGFVYEVKTGRLHEVSD